MTLACTRLALPIIVSAGMLAGVPTPGRAQGESDPAAKCATWIAKKGYSRDYVEQRTGARPLPGAIGMTTFGPGSCKLEMS